MDRDPQIREMQLDVIAAPLSLVPPEMVTVLKVEFVFWAVLL